MVYTCTQNDTKVTTTIMSAVSLSTRKPTSMRIPSLTSQVYTESLNVGAPSQYSCFSTLQDKRKVMPTAVHVTQWAPARPITRPKMPAMTAAVSGNRTIARRTSGLMPALSFHHIQFFDVDASALAEQHHENGQANRGLGRRDGQDK